MKKIKLKSDYNTNNIIDLFKTCMLHANFKNDFGSFCAGGALVLRSVFKEIQKAERGEIINFDTNTTIVTTAGLLDGLEGVKRDLAVAEMDDKNENEMLSEKILTIAEQILKDRDKEE